MMHWTVRAFFICLLIEKLVASEEAEIKMEFFGYDLEDQCVIKNDIVFQYYNGSKSSISKLKEVIYNTTSMLKAELEKIEEVQQKNGLRGLSDRGQRMLNMLMKPGPAALPEPVLNEYSEFVIKATEEHSLKQETKRALITSKNASKLLEIWQKSYEDLEKKSNLDFSSQLLRLDLEARHNGLQSQNRMSSQKLFSADAEDVTSYWLSQNEITWANYTSVLDCWSQLIPLYQKLRKFLAKNIIVRHQSKVFNDPKLIPIHLLGTFDSTDWVTAAEKLNAFGTSDTYRELAKKLRTFDDTKIYRKADLITSDLKDLPESFFKASQFEVESENCTSQMADHCKNDLVPRVLTCKNPQKDENPVLLKWIQAHQHVARIKHFRLAASDDRDNPFIFKEGLRQSALYEALNAAGSIMALQPTSLEKVGMLETLPKDANLTGLLIAALHIIPSMPYYLSADLWRLQAIKNLKNQQETNSAHLSTSEIPSTAAFNVPESFWNIPESAETDSSEEHVNEETTLSSTTISTTDHAIKSTTATANSVTSNGYKSSSISLNEEAKKSVYNSLNVTQDWWKLRADFQGLAPPNAEKLVTDYLQDQNIITNTPYLAHFIGRILMFQILDRFQQGKMSDNMKKLMDTLQKGKSDPWEKIVMETFEIKAISIKPMLTFFQPLEVWLDAGGTFSSLRNTMINSSFNSFLPTNSKPFDGKTVEEASSGSNAFLLVLFALAAVGSVAALVSHIKSRRKKRKQRQAKKSRMAGQTLYNQVPTQKV